MVGTTIHRPGAVVRPGGIDALPLIGPPDQVTVVTDSLSDFARLLQPVRGILAANPWVLNCDDCYLRFPPDWYDDEGAKGNDPRLREAERLILLRHKKWKYVDGRFLELVADSLIDEWWDFFAVRDPVSDIAGWVSAFWSAKDSKTHETFIESQAHFFVAGIDGVRWDFFSSVPSDIELIRSHAEQLPGFRVAPTTLRDHLSYFYGQPGHLEYPVTNAEADRCG